MTIDLTKIILSFLGLILAVLARYVIPWLKARTGVENEKLTETQAALLRLAIDAAVTAAEQLYKSDEGQKKKAYVLAALESQGFTVDSIAVDTAIESAVFKVHQKLNP